MVNRLIKNMLISFLFLCLAVGPVEEKYTAEEAWKVIDTFLNQVSTDDNVQSMLKDRPEIFSII